MAQIDALLERNRHFARTHAYEGGPIYPRCDVCVLTCLDPRTDPANFLELGVGDAVVIRNAGGRVTPALIDDLAFITYLSETVVRPDSALFEVAVVHHTRCGTHFLADAGFRHRFEQQVGAEDRDAELAAEAVVDPVATVRHDVALLLAAATLSRRISISGHVYDVDTGLVTTIVPAAPMPSADRSTAAPSPRSARAR